jgi:hypothetical protein
MMLIGKQVVARLWNKAIFIRNRVAQAVFKIQAQEMRRPPTRHMRHWTCEEK